MEQLGTNAENESSIHALEAGFSTLLQPLAQAGGVDLTTPCLAEFIKAQAAAFYCQFSPRELRKAGRRFLFSKKGLFVRSAHIDEALQKLGLQSLRQCILA